MNEDGNRDDGRLDELKMRNFSLIIIMSPYEYMSSNCCPGRRSHPRSDCKSAVVQGLRTVGYVAVGIAT